jgi:hypothetical protein
MGVNMFNKLPPGAHSISNKIFNSFMRSWLFSYPLYKLSVFCNAHVDTLVSFILSFLLLSFALF